ncbi:glycoside hydrolase superfamily [Amylocystis lapponica]|nr:glycoside hydrolase superfamily [Amylocystis lapponica]
MSGNYDPVPSGQSYYDGPPGPTSRRYSRANFETEPLELQEDPGSSRSPRARFMGAALAHDNPRRNSFNSSHTDVPTAVDDSSLYALNHDPARNNDGVGFYGLNYQDDPHGSDFNPSEQTIAHGGLSPKQTRSPYLDEKRTAYAAPRARSKRRAFFIVGAVLLVVTIIIVVVAVYFGVVKPHSDSSSTSGGLAGASGSASSGKAAPTASGSSNSLVVSGGDGSKITTESGTTFTYSNPFGGYWYYDPANPLNNAARAQSWTPALNESFGYGSDPIRGVNLGGWLVTEPFIVPALYQKYLNSSPVAIDEWTLSANMRADTAGGGINQLEDHYKTFITEQDFAEIAGAGLNWVRIPLPYWAIETRDDEPFLANVCWTYFLKAIEWARKYGIRINLDFHSLPGSQNGWNHSGKLGTINVLNGPMGLANAQRSLAYIRILAEFISQPQYSPVVAMFGITNEPVGSTIGQSNLAAYYWQAYNIVREASGIGEGKGPFVSFHEGFFTLAGWAGFLPGADRTALDVHPYVCFEGQSAEGYSTQLNVPCQTWAANQNTSMTAFGLSGAGEWSNALNDCGLWVNGVNQGTRYEGTYTMGGNYPRIGSCDPWTDWQSWNATFKASIEDWALESMSALQNWFFWTWKIGNSTTSGTVEAPAWSYQLGLQNGWMPADPRAADGLCDNTDPFAGPLSAWQTGGVGAGTIPASVSTKYPWPPTSIPNAGFATAVTALPSYTPTGTGITLAAPTFSASGAAVPTASVGSGWANPSDSVGVMVPISTCSYLDPWIGPTAPPSPLCS